MIQQLLSSRVLLSAVSALLLAACGGGGGGSSSVAPVATAPGDAGDVGGVTVSGRVLASEGARADSDTNDSSAPRSSNDSIALAQILPNPFVLNGYVNTPRSGEPGASFSNGDISDFYRGSFTAGQLITLMITDKRAGDLDLRLRDSGGTVVAESLSFDADESVSVPADGDYSIEVMAFGEATQSSSSYILTVAQNSAQAANAEPTWTAHRALVKLSKPEQAGADFASRFGTSNRHIGDDVWLMDWSEPEQRRTLSTELGGALLPASVPASLEAQAEDTYTLIKKLNRRPEFAYVVPDYRRHSHLEPGDEFYPIQWHYPQINLPAAWEQTQGSRQVRVAVIDTGVLTGHPDLIPNLDPNDPNGYDFVSDLGNGDGDGRDGDASDPGDDGINSVFHGSHVAGTVAAATDNIEGAVRGSGVAGAAWDTVIMPIRALGRNGGSSVDIIEAVRYAAGLPNASGELPQQEADIINLSLGGPGGSVAERDLFRQVRDLGILVFASAGNTGDSSVEFPAAHDAVHSVAATDIQNRRASYSTTNAFVAVAAPGGAQGDVNGDGFVDFVLSTSGERQGDGSVRSVYRFLQGTSMAAPHVSAVAALMKAVHPALTPADFDALLEGGLITRDLGAPGRDSAFGYGLIDAQLAVEQALNLAGGGQVPDNPRLQLSPSGLNFGNATTALLLQARNSGNGSLQVNAISDDAPWLEVLGDEVDSDGLGRYQVSVDRSSLADGIYRAVINFSSSANSLNVPVIMQVGGDNSNSVGNLFTILVRAEDESLVDQVQGVAVDGVYSFSFSNVPPGEYLLISGSDIDEDLFICDPGEACGVYLTADQPQSIVVGESDLRDLEYGAGFELSIGGASSSSVNKSKDQGDGGWRLKENP